MAVLHTQLRNRLEAAVKQARRTAEAAARVALERLTVGSAEPGTHLSIEDRQLRNRLRAHGRQLGDARDSKTGTQSINRLKHECAYEHWHRMLFARFLSENQLLIHEKEGMPVTLAECDELAVDEGAPDGWTLAARYAARMLPQIFRPGDPVLQVGFAPEHKRALEKLVTGLPVEVFTASDSLGWCYQFWQAERKDQVNAAGNKIGADELPSVTQLFTEDYMVDFLLDNTLGAWHAGKVLAANPKLAETARSEEELRQACALPGCPWKYLRFVLLDPGSSGRESAPSETPKSESRLTSAATKGRWTPAAGTFDGWPKTAKELKCLDPCMGSGHFVVAMFERLVALRRAEEKLDEAAAVAAVIRDNLFGLEIDPRCTQIGAFNLALAAWRRVGHRPLPAMNLACSGLAPNTREADWLAMVDAASSRTLKDKPERLEASATFAPINYFRPDEPVANLTGNLPHWRQEGTTYFVTFRCADALPQERLHQWQQELEQWQAAHPEPHDESTRQEFYERFPKRIQTWLDSGYGECALRETAMREIVESALRHFDGQRYRLQEFVVAANHVHALVTPLGEHRLSDILHSWKSFTANKINEVRKKSGAFWQKESFDHIVRSPASLAKFREYILSHNKMAAANVAAASSRTPQEEERLEAAATMRLRAGMERLYRLFQKAAVLGSLINPRAGEGDLLVAAFHELQPLLEKALAQETKDDTAHEMAVTARGLAKAAEILAGQFTLVATNVPYLKSGNQVETLKEFCRTNFLAAKSDLATCFIERCLGFCSNAGSVTLVSPQNWLYQPAYAAMRRRLLEDYQWNCLAKLGPHAFETITGEVVNVSLVSITAQSSHTGRFMGIEASDEATPMEKAIGLQQIPVLSVEQRDQLKNPEHRVVISGASEGKLLMALAQSYKGITSNDDPQFFQNFWEQQAVKNGWEFLQSTVKDTQQNGGLESIVLYEGGHGRLRAFAEAQDRDRKQDFRGIHAWGKPGVAVSCTGSLPVSFYSGHKFDTNAAVITPNDGRHLPAIWAFCSSAKFNEEVRKIDQSLKVTNATLVKVPFDLAHWQKVAAEKYPHGLPKPFSSDPTQWLFNGHPAGADQPLHVAVARLLGYQWPRQTGSNYPDCPALGPDGLETLADEDGIVCIPSVRGEQPAADRVRELIVAAYGKQWSPARQDELLRHSRSSRGNEALTSSGKGKNEPPHVGCYDNLEDWLRNGFFEQHYKLFHHRPFIWQIWDGRKDGFSALVNYHKLDHKLLEKLTYTYLGEWLKKQQDAVANEESGADDRLVKARQLQDKLKLILEGEAYPEENRGYDIFVRWKPKEQQPIGWHPDLNDGVRLNIRPFMEADVLRKRPNIKWGIDRGKNPPGAPWGAERDNDRHLTLAEKRKARET